MRLGVIGLGKIGACLAVVLSQRHSVIGVDTNPDVVKAINHNVPPPNVFEPLLDAYLSMRNDAFVATTKMADIVDRDYVFVIVPTPSNEYDLFNPACVLSALVELYKNFDLRKATSKMGIVIVSTLTPETMVTEIDALTAIVLGESADRVELIYSPVFVALGSVVQDLRSPDTMLIGTRDGRCSDAVRGFVDLFREDLFARTVDAVYMTWCEAELAKLFANVMLSVKSLYANELALLAQGVGVDAAPILAFAGNDSRIGHKMLGSGFPPGGTCLPRDVRCINAYARKVFKHGLPLLEAMIPARELQFRAIASMIAVGCAGRKSIGILGLAYKSGVQILEESGSMILASTLFETFGIRPYLHDYDIQVPETDSAFQQLDSVTDILAATEVIVLGTNDRRYKDELLCSDVLRTHAVYDIWGLLTAEQTKHAKNYRRFGKGH